MRGSSPNETRPECIASFVAEIVPRETAVYEANIMRPFEFQFRSIRGLTSSAVGLLVAAIGCSPATSFAQLAYSWNTRREP
jgi:hypothetical protein